MFKLGYDNLEYTQHIPINLTKKSDSEIILSIKELNEFIPIPLKDVEVGEHTLLLVFNQDDRNKVVKSKYESPLCEMILHDAEFTLEFEFPEDFEGLVCEEPLAARIFQVPLKSCFSLKFSEGSADTLPPFLTYRTKEILPKFFSSEEG